MNDYDQTIADLAEARTALWQILAGVEAKSVGWARNTDAWLQRIESCIRILQALRPLPELGLRIPTRLSGEIRYLEVRTDEKVTRPDIEHLIEILKVSLDAFPLPTPTAPPPSGRFELCPHALDLTGAEQCEACGPNQHTHAGPGVRFVGEP